MYPSSDSGNSFLSPEMLAASYPTHAERHGNKKRCLAKHRNIHNPTMQRECESGATIQGSFRHVQYNTIQYSTIIPFVSTQT